MWESTLNPVTLLMNVHDDRLQEDARERLVFCQAMQPCSCRFYLVSRAFSRRIIISRSSSAQVSLMSPVPAFASSLRPLWMRDGVNEASSAHAIARAQEAMKNLAITDGNEVAAMAAIIHYATVQIHVKRRRRQTSMLGGNNLDPITQA